MLKKGRIEDVYKGRIPSGNLVYVVTPKAKSPLAPSKDLMNRWKKGMISKREFMEEYLKELKNRSTALSLIEKIAIVSAYKDVWLVTDNNGFDYIHILLEIVEKCLNQKDKPVKVIIDKMIEFL